MAVIEFFVGAVVGSVGSSIIKDKVYHNPLEKKVKKLSSELSNSSNQIKHLKEHINNLEDTISSQNNELISLRKEVNRKDNSLEDEKDKSLSIHKTNNQILSENEKLKIQLNELNQLYTARKQELHTLQDKYDELKRKS